MKPVQKTGSRSGRLQTFRMLLPPVIMVFIFIQSALPADVSSVESGFFVELIGRLIPTDPEQITFLVRKAAHFLEYLALGLSLLAALSVKKKRDRSRLWRICNEGNPAETAAGMRIYMTAQGIGSAYAVSDEIHQWFVPGRSCELRDILLDSAGVCCGLLIAAAIRRRRQKSVM